MNAMENCSAESHTLLIRWRIGRDDREVLQIDDRCYIDSLSQRDLKDLLADRSVIAVVAEDRNTILGYCIYQLGKHAIRILRCGVDPRERRCGVATAMLDRLKDKVANHRRTEITVEVAGHAIAAQLCLCRAGFIGEPMPLDQIRFTYAKDQS